jgi:hypothetical protein
MANTQLSTGNPDGSWTWTLTSILGDSLSIAEQRFGPRDESYSILGIEFVDHTVPYIWYIATGKHIIIRLTQSCMTDFNQGVFQLTHEVIHCLSPDRSVKSTVLEEGLATYFSTVYSKNHGGLRTTDQRYLNASLLVEEILKIDIDIIKKIRIVQPKISLIGEADIIGTNSSVPQELARAVAQLF